MFDRIAICQAYNAYATLFHGGQWSTEYQIFGRLSALRYREGAASGGSDSPYSLGIPKDASGENDCARDLLASIVRRHRNGTLYLRAR